MGALTSSGKRDSTSTCLDSQFQASKKPRFSGFRDNSYKQTLAVGSSNTTVSRVSQYPQSTPKKWKREIHAPCRTLRFGMKQNESTRGAMTSFLVKRLELAKKHALDAFRYVFVDKPALPTIENENNQQVSKKLEYDVECGVSETQKIELIEDESDENAEGNLKIVEERSVVTLNENDCIKTDDENLEKSGLTIYDEGVEVYASRVEAIKKLEDTVKRRNSRLADLSFEIELNEKKLSAIRLSRPPKKPEKTPSLEVPAEAFLPLTIEEEEEVDNAFNFRNRNQVLVSHESTNIDVTSENLQCLMPKAWLNDEIINVYLELLKEREKREPHKFKKCHFFNTFFFKKLTSGGYNYKAVKRWTTEKKLGYFLADCERIFVPVHRQIHWCLAIINKKDAKFQYLDSLGGQDLGVLEILAKYYVDEVKDKCRKVIDVSHWEREFPDNLPEQQNGYDCGVFMIKYADFSSRGVGFCFSQGDMSYFRKKTAKEILRLRAE